MADLHESHEEQVERTVSSPEAVTRVPEWLCATLSNLVRANCEEKLQISQLDQEYRNHNRRPRDHFCGLPGYSCEISFAIRNGAYSLSGRYFLGLCDGGIRDAAVLFRASGSYQGSRPREMLLC